MWLLGNRALLYSALWVWGKSGLIVTAGPAIVPPKAPTQVAKAPTQAAKASTQAAKASRQVATARSQSRPAKAAKKCSKKIAAKAKKSTVRHHHHNHGSHRPDWWKKGSLGGVSARDARALRRGSRSPSQRQGKGRFTLSSPIPSAKVCSGYGWRMGPISGKMGFHRGWDYAASFGTPVRAAAGGLIWRIGWMGSCGMGVVIVHRSGVSTSYCHLSQILAPHRKSVKRGEIIGRVGSTGSSTSPHLHFSVLHRGKFVNPSKFMKK